MSKDRFAGDFGRKYYQFLWACPHYDDYQRFVGEAIQSWGQANPGLEQIRAVEVGCGTGYTTRKMLNADPRVHVTGIDLSQTMIQQAQQVLVDERERLEFIQMDALNALQQLPDESMDVFASAFTMHNFPPALRRSVYEEARRVVRPGGLFVVSDKIAQEDEKEHAAALALQLAQLSVCDPDVEAEWHRHYAEDDLIRLTEAEQRELLELGGCDPPSIYKAAREQMEAMFVGIKS